MGRANARPMTGSAKQSISLHKEEWIALSLALLAMTKEGPYSSAIGNCLYFDGLRRQARQ
jgi:hypothetical protein